IVLLESLRILGCRASIPSSRAMRRAAAVARRLRSSPSMVLIQPPSVQALGRAHEHLQLGRKELGEEEEGGQPHVALDEDEEVRPSDVANGNQARERRTVPYAAGDRPMIPEPSLWVVKEISRSDPSGAIYGAAGASRKLQPPVPSYVT